MHNSIIATSMFIFTFLPPKEGIWVQPVRDNERKCRVSYATPEISSSFFLFYAELHHNYAVLWT